LIAVTNRAFAGRRPRSAPPPAGEDVDPSLYYFRTTDLRGRGRAAVG
jgi:hypothetical protein